MTQARRENRVGFVPYAPGVPVNTFWDIGNSDGTAIWFHQRVGQENRLIRFYEAWGEPYRHFVAEMQRHGYVWGSHYLPHDAAHKRQQGDANLSPVEMLEALGLQNIEVVPRVDDVIHGIQQTRDIFSTLWIDSTACAEGIKHLDLYRKEWNDRMGCWSNRPRHDVHSEAADALRQLAQGYKGERRARTPMPVRSSRPF